MSQNNLNKIEIIGFTETNSPTKQSGPSAFVGAKIISSLIYFISPIVIIQFGFTTSGTMDVYVS